MITRGISVGADMHARRGNITSCKGIMMSAECDGKENVKPIIPERGTM